jgi:hypothetical protein
MMLQGGRVLRDIEKYMGLEGESRSFGALKAT